MRSINDTIKVVKVDTWKKSHRSRWFLNISVISSIFFLPAKMSTQFARWNHRSLINKINRNLQTERACNIVIFERRMIAYSSLRLYLPLIRLSTLPLFLCWIKQLITLHCGTRRQWRPLLLYRAIHKAKRPALLREETDEWGIRRTYIYHLLLDLRIHIRSFILLDIFFIETALSRYIDFISDQLLPRSMDFERSWGQKGIDL